jgi:hypothetical protein
MYTNELRVEIRDPHTHRVKPLSRINPICATGRSTPPRLFSSRGNVSQLISCYYGVSRNSVVVCSDADQAWEREWRWERLKQTKRPRRPWMRVGNL